MFFYIIVFMPCSVSITAKVFHYVIIKYLHGYGCRRRHSSLFSKANREILLQGVFVEIPADKNECVGLHATFSTKNSSTMSDIF